MINVLSLFSGVGGLDIGAHVGFQALGEAARTVAYCERDPYAAATLVARMEAQALDTAPVWDDWPRSRHGALLDLWIASLQDSRVNHGRSPASAAESRTPVGCGRLSFGSHGMFDPDTYSWKTSQGLFSDMGLNACSVTWAPTTYGNASLSWPTPDANRSSYSNGHNGFKNLRQAAAEWATPNSSRRTEARRGHSVNTGETTSWATPSARDYRNGKASVTTLNKNSRPLNEQAHLWTCSPPAATIQRGIKSLGGG